MKTTPTQPPIYAAAAQELADRLEPIVREQILERQTFRMLSINQAAGLCNMTTQAFVRRFRPWIITLGLRDRGISVDALRDVIAAATPGHGGVTQGGGQKV